jgi:branched-chain amino acid transport system permease protein
MKGVTMRVVLEIMLWVGCLLLPLCVPDQVLLLSQIAILALFALSLDLLIGQAGILSLGHAAFFGLGAYAAALVALAGWEEPLSALFMSIAIAAAAGAITAPLVIRAHGLAQLMITLSIGLLLHEAASRARGISGGDDGLSGFMNSSIFGLFEFDLWGFTAYYYALACLAIGFLFYSLLLASPFGYALRGLRQNPLRMASMGTPVRLRQMQAYVIAAGMAGAAGALLVQTTQSVALEVLSFQRSAEVLVIIILGGIGHRYGALIGAALYVLARDALSAGTPEYWHGWLGALMILVVLLAPSGVFGLIARLRAMLSRVRRKEQTA